LDLKDGVLNAQAAKSTVPVFSAAGRLDSVPHEKVEQALGDGLVTNESALAWPNSSGKVFPKTGHLALLEADDCYEWLHQTLSGIVV
jgi:pimeloyl-ACP methyl ester carboxylesterase